MTVHQKGEGRCPNVLACSLSHFQAVLMVLWCLYWTKEWLFSFLICPPFSCISCVYSSCVLIGILAESWSSSPNADPLAWIKAGNPLKKKKRVQRQKGRFTEIGCCLRILTFSEKKKVLEGLKELDLVWKKKVGVWPSGVATDLSLLESTGNAGASSLHPVVDIASVLWIASSCRLWSICREAAVKHGGLLEPVCCLSWGRKWLMCAGQGEDRWV